MSDSESTANGQSPGTTVARTLSKQGEIERSLRNRFRALLEAHQAVALDAEALGKEMEQARGFTKAHLVIAAIDGVDMLIQTAPTDNCEKLGDFVAFLAVVAALVEATT